MKTIRQVADEIGVSKQAVSKRLSQLSPTEVTTNEKGVKLISIEGVRVLSELIAPTKNLLSLTKPPIKEKLPPTIGDEVVELLRDSIVALQKQLQIKDEQIAIKDKQIETERTHNREQTEKLSEQAERIIDLATQLAELNRNNQLLLGIEQSRTNSVLSVNNESAPHDNGEQKPKESFLRKLFKRT